MQDSGFIETGSSQETTATNAHKIDMYKLDEEIKEYTTDYIFMKEPESTNKKIEINIVKSYDLNDTRGSISNHHAIIGEII